MSDVLGDTGGEGLTQTVVPWANFKTSSPVPTSKPRPLAPLQNLAPWTNLKTSSREGFTHFTRKPSKPLSKKAPKPLSRKARKPLSSKKGPKPLSKKLLSRNSGKPKPPSSKAPKPKTLNCSLRKHEKAPKPQCGCWISFIHLTRPHT